MTGSTEPTTDGSLSTLSRRRILQGTAGAGLLSLLSSTVSADGTTDLVVRAEKVDVPMLASDASVVDELKAEAEESQKPVVEYAENTDGLSVKNQFWLMNGLLLEVDTDEVDPEELRARKGVAAVHPNYELELPDPQAGSVDAEDADVTYGLDQIDAPEAWNEFDARGQGADVAVLDTGVDPDHPDIDIQPENFSEFDSDGNEVDSEPRDSSYHGTHVSGTATGGDSSGTAIGVAPEATLLHSLVLPDGSGSFTQIIAGMEWAVENDADVISMSLGATGFYTQMIEPVRNARDAGVITVAAAGNDGEGTTGSPGNVYDSFSVGASDDDAGIASFSSGEVVDAENAWGSAAPDDWPDEYVVPDASAPGVEVLSSYPVDHPNGPYNRISGTSMATPHVSGLVGLMESAGAEDVTPDQIASALTTTAWKPDDAPDGKDNRYGDGIVDAVDAVARVAADSGVEGTVTDDDGNPVEDATVVLGDFPDRTDANGEYRLRAASGTYDLTVDAFGYAEQSTEVEVTDSFVTRDFTLADDLAVTTVAGQPGGLEAGESFDVELEVANADSVTVDLAGTYSGEAWLSVNGEDATFGQPYSFDGTTSGAVTLTVETGDDATGDLELDVAVDGLGESVSLTTGPTSVYANPVAVGIVDDAGAFGTDIADLLESEMHQRYNFYTLAGDEAVSAARNRDHDAYLVQNLSTDDEVVSEFADVATAPDVGVVYLDQFGTASDAIYQLSGATDNPASTAESYVTLSAPPVDYAFDRDHPVLDGVAGEGDFVTINTPEPVRSGFYVLGGFHSYFEDYTGPVAAPTLARTALSSSVTGEGLAVDDLSRIALASSMGVGSYVGADVFTDEGASLLGNLVSYVAETPPVEVVSTPAERIDPGTSTTVELAVSDLVEMRIDVADLEYLDEGDLTLTVDGESAEFGDTFTYDDPYDGTVEVTVGTPAGEVGQFALDASFVGLDDGGREVETSATFRPTAVYTSPIEVPSQLEDLQAAVDFVRSGDGVRVAGGTYEVVDDRGVQTGLYVGTPNITIEGAPGETVEIVHAEDPPSPNVINVDADDVTVENVSANVRDGAVANEIGFGVRVNEGVSGTTVRNSTVVGTNGVFLDANVSDVTVEGATTFDSPIAVGTDLSGGPVENVTVTDLTYEDPYSFGWAPVYIENGDQVTVTGADITYGASFDGGVVVWGDFSASDDNRIADNTIVGPDAGEPSYGFGDVGIYVDEANTVIENNEITDAYIGVRVGEFGFGERDVYVEHNTVENAGVGYFQTGDYVSLEHNEFDAETGLDLRGDFYRPAADAVVARHNDFSEADLPFIGSPSDGYGDPEGPFDLRMNYLGDRSYDETIADGEIVYDPFLTDPPEDAGVAGADASASASGEVTNLGTDLYLEPGDTYGLGVPGPTDRTIYEILGVESFREFAGDLEYWNAQAGKFQRVTGQGELKYVDTLDAFRVTPDEGVRAVVDFQSREETPPGHHETDTDATTLDRGWNFVAAPQYGDESAVFDYDGIAEVADEFHAPGGQIGEGEVMAFNGYKVKAGDSTELPAGLTEYDPTMSELYESLGLDPVIHDPVGPQAEPGESTITVADVLEAAGDDEAADAVAAFAGHRLGQRVASVDDVDAAGGEIASAADDIVSNAPSGDRDLVEDAVAAAAEVVIRSTFGAVEVGEDEETGDYDTATAAAAAERAGSASSVSLADSVALD